jgi:hypothetical protein
MKRFFVRGLMLPLFLVPNLVFSQSSASENAQQNKEILHKESPSKDILPTKSLPADYPSQSELSAEQFEKAKKQWILDNPSEYNELIPKHEQKKDLSSLPGFPIYVDTGNPELDHQEYQNSKMKWYQENEKLIHEFLKSQENENDEF